MYVKTQTLAETMAPSNADSIDAEDPSTTWVNKSSFLLSELSSIEFTTEGGNKQGNHEGGIYHTIPREIYVVPSNHIVSSLLPLYNSWSNITPFCKILFHKKYQTRCTSGRTFILWMGNLLERHVCRELPRHGW